MNRLKLLRNILTIIISALYFIISLPTLKAQQISANASIDTNKIWIGGQTNLKLSVTANSTTKIKWPILKDSIQKIELISIGKIDTSYSTDKKFTTYAQSIVITSFDTGFKAIPPVVFHYSQLPDTNKIPIETQALLLHVKGIQVDTTQAIKAIKPPLAISFSLIDFLVEYWYYLLAIALLIGIAIWWLKFRKSTPKTKIELPSEPLKPAHEIALEQLKILEDKKLWQTGSYKSYHSELTDILRTYIEGRYTIMAMELTSEEILKSLRNLDPTNTEKLSQILLLADFVKFAKGIPIHYENELSLRNAYDFINSTMITSTTTINS